MEVSTQVVGQPTQLGSVNLVEIPVVEIPVVEIPVVEILVVNGGHRQLEIREAGFALSDGRSLANLPQSQSWPAVALPRLVTDGESATLRYDMDSLAAIIAGNEPGTRFTTAFARDSRGRRWATPAPEQVRRLARQPVS